MRLIASDLDGTLLLRGEKKLHNNTVSAIEKLLCDNVAFCVSSGRSYSELKKIFEDISDKIYFIANDGTQIVYKEKDIFNAPIPAEKVKIFDGEKCVVAHSKYISFVKSDSERFIRMIKEQYRGHILKADSLEEISEPVYKIVLYGKRESNFDLNRVYCRNDVCEYVQSGINKGAAVAELSRILGISEKDIVAIGDGINDIEMLKAAEKSYVIANAPPVVKKAGTYIVDGFEDAVEMLLKE